MNLTHPKNRGRDFEKVVTKLSSLSGTQRELAIGYLKNILAEDKPAKAARRRATSTISTIEQLIRLYPNVDFAGFISRENDKGHHQLWKLIDAFEEASRQLGLGAFKKLRITLIVFGKKITYVSDGTIAINYERFSKANLVKQLVTMAQQQG